MVVVTFVASEKGSVEKSVRTVGFDARLNRMDIERELVVVTKTVELFDVSASLVGI